MATLTPFSTLHSSICSLTPHRTSNPSLTHLPFTRNFHLQTNNSNCISVDGSKFSTNKQKLNHLGMRVLRSVEEETLIPELQVQEELEQGETVSVPVSPSDTLTMFLQADGAMNETAIPTVTKALEETEGISNLNVQVLEGVATVELTKQTTVQSTGVASSLVEIIQGAGFKLQTLNLSFEDEEDILV